MQGPLPGSLWRCACLMLLCGSAVFTAQDFKSAKYEFVNRYEGLLDLPIAGPDRPGLDLVSFVGSFEPFSSNVDLVVDFFLPPAAQPRLVAQELAADRFYRMEAKPGGWTPGIWHRFGPWPAGDVILPRRVRTANIGVLIRLDEKPEGTQFIAPAFVHHSPASPALTRYRAQLRPVRATLGAVDYTLERIDHDRLVTVVRESRPGERIEGEPFRVDVDASSLEEGRFRLTVVGYVRNSTQRIPRQYEFEHRRLPR